VKHKQRATKKALFFLSATTSVNTKKILKKERPRPNEEQIFSFQQIIETKNNRLVSFLSAVAPHVSHWWCAMQNNRTD